MISRPTIVLTFLFALVTGLSLSSTAFGQAMGADDFEVPDDDLPGEADTAPPTSGADPLTDDPAAVHPTDDTDPAPAAVDRDLGEGDQSVSVRLHHANDNDVRFVDHPVTLQAVPTPGPMESDAHRQVVDSWSASTDDEGVAHFDDLPDDLARRGLLLEASTTATVSGGTYSFRSDLVSPADTSELDLNIYDATGEYPGLRIVNKRVLVSPWEDYLVFDQFWTIEIEGDRVFDTTLSDDSTLEDGLPLRLPYQAEGISFAGPGHYQNVNNVIYWHGVFQPDQPVTVQIRFSKSARSSSMTFEQPMQYPVDDIQILAPIETSFDKVPRLDDLSLAAPGFEVGNDPAMAGLHTDTDFLVATGHSVDRGESYTFRLEGLPFGRPLGGWIALVGGLVAALGIAAYGRREYLAFRDAENRDDAMEALQRQRDEILDELASVTWALDTTEDPAEIDELEAEETLLRQRLTLVLGKIDDLKADTADDESSPDDTA